MDASGFFYQGSGDKVIQISLNFLYYNYDSFQVRCFSCGISIFAWTPDDTPFGEHTRWSSSCDFLKKIKAEEELQMQQIKVETDEKCDDQGFDTARE